MKLKFDVDCRISISSECLFPLLVFEFDTFGANIFQRFSSGFIDITEEGNSDDVIIGITQDSTKRLDKSVKNIRKSSNSSNNSSRNGDDEVFIEKEKNLSIITNSNKKQIPVGNDVVDNNTQSKAKTAPMIRQKSMSKIPVKNRTSK